MKVKYATTGCLMDSCSIGTGSLPAAVDISAAGPDPGTASERSFGVPIAK